MPVLAQTTPPPAPTPTPVPVCPPDFQENCAWIGAVLNSYGLPLLLLAGVVLVVWWLWQRVQKVSEKKVEALAEETWKKAEADDALGQSTQRYLDAVIEDYRFVKFRGQGARARGIEPPELDRVYVSLRMTPEGRTRSVDKGKSTERPEGGLPLEKAEPVSLAEAIRQSPRLAIVGVAGSGKSTLLQWAGLACARRKSTRPSDEQKKFVEALEKSQPLVPILLPLRDYNRHCAEMKLPRTAQTLLDFMSVHVAAEHPNLKLPPIFFHASLARMGRVAC